MNVSVEFLCPHYCFWLGSWHSLNAGQKVNPHIRIFKFANYEARKMLSVAAFCKGSFPGVLKSFSEICMLRGR